MHSSNYCVLTASRNWPGRGSPPCRAACRSNPKRICMREEFAKADSLSSHTFYEEECNMVKMYYDQDAQLDVLKGKTVAVIGYGSQGHAQAQNLRDSGVHVIIGLRPGRSWEQAEQDGFEVFEVDEAVRRAEVVQLLLPDE